MSVMSPESARLRRLPDRHLELTVYMEVRERQKIRPSRRSLRNKTNPSWPGRAFRSSGSAIPWEASLTRECSRLLYLRAGVALCVLRAFLVDRLARTLHDAYARQRVPCSRRPRPVTSMSAKLFGTRWPRRGSAANRATMTMADQCVASASNFAVGIVVARISGPSGLGAFALAYTVWILLTTLHRSLITDPMAIMGDMRGDEKEEFVRRGFAADVTLGLMAACIIAAVGSALLVVGQAHLRSGPALGGPMGHRARSAGLLAMDRLHAGTPRKSLMNDLLFNAVQAVAFGVVFLAGLHSVFAVVAAWGLGAAVAAALWSPAILGAPFAYAEGRAFLWSRWPTSQWLASERAASWGASQLYLILAGVILGPAALGGLKAAQGLVAGPTTLVINAERKLRLARGDQTACRARLDGDDEGVPVRHWGGACGVCSPAASSSSWQRPRS